jgi:four helix bundle protein
MALGSLAEIHTQLLIGRNLGYWDTEMDKIQVQVEELQKMTHSLISKLKTKN